MSSINYTNVQSQDLDPRLSNNRSESATGLLLLLGELRIFSMLQLLLINKQSIIMHFN